MALRPNRGRGPGAALALGLALLSAPAAAQPVSFAASDYGQARLPERQTTGDAARWIAANEGGAFEPIGELAPGEPMADLALPVGRVDVLLRDEATGEESAGACTGALVGGGLVLTNHHCLPQIGPLHALEASILMDYLRLDGEGAQRFALDVTPVDWDADLDFAVLRVEGAPEAAFGRVALGASQADLGPSRTVIHHPLARPKVMSRFRCRMLDGTGPGAGMAHRCDTLPGSSGSLLFDARGVAVELHREGGLVPDDPTSFNMATDMAAILAASEVLAEAAGNPPVASADPDPGAGAGAASDGVPAGDAPAAGALSRDDMNAILRGQ